MARTRVFPRVETPPTTSTVPAVANPPVVVIDDREKKRRRKPPAATTEVVAPKRRRRSRRVVSRSAGLSSPAIAIGIGLGGAVVGYAQARGLFDRLPAIAGSKMVTLGVAGYLVSRYVRNPHVKLAGLAAMAIAANDFGRKQGGAVSGDDLGDDLGDDII